MELFSMINREVGSLGVRPLCNQVFDSPSTFCQLTSRSNGRSNRYFSSGLECLQSIYTPFLVPHLKSTFQGACPSSNTGHCCPTLADTSAVPTTGRHACGASRSFPSQAGDSEAITKLWLPASGQNDRVQLKVSGCTLIQKEFWRKLFTSSLHPGEKKKSNYNSSWCSAANIYQSLCSGFTWSTIGFLAKQFEEGRQYKSLNCYQSAISSTHMDILWESTHSCAGS